MRAEGAGQPACMAAVEGHRRRQIMRQQTAKRPRAVVEGATRGRSVVIGLQTRPTRRTMADRVCRALKAISESPLISVNELEKFAAVHVRRSPSVRPGTTRCVGAFEHERRAVRGRRRDDQFASCSAAFAPSAACAAAWSRTAKRIAASRMPRATSGGSTAEMQPEGRRVHHLDLAARRLDRDAARGRLQIASRRRRLSGTRDGRPDCRRRTRRPRRPSRRSRCCWNAGFQKFSG